MSGVISSRVSIPSCSQESTSSTKILGLLPSPAVASFSLVTGTSSPLVNPRRQSLSSTPEHNMEQQFRLLNQTVAGASRHRVPLPQPQVRSKPQPRRVVRTASDPRQHLQLEAEDHCTKPTATVGAIDLSDSSSSIVRPSSIENAASGTVTTAATSRQEILAKKMEKEEEEEKQHAAAVMPVSASTTTLPAVAFEQTATQKVTSTSSRKVDSKSSESKEKVTPQAKLTASKESTSKETNQVEVEQPTTRSNKKKKKQTAKVQATNKKKQSQPQPAMSEEEKIEKARMIRLKEHQLIAVEEERIDLSRRSHSKPKKDDDEPFADELRDNSMPSMSTQVNVLTSEGGDRFIEFDSLLRLITPSNEKTTSYENHWNKEVMAYLNKDLSKKDRREAFLFQYYHLRYKGRSVSCLQESAFVDFIDVMNRWLVKCPANEVIRILAQHIDLVCWRVFEPQPENNHQVVRWQEEESNKYQIDNDTEMKEQHEKAEEHRKNGATKCQVDEIKDEVLPKVVICEVKTKRSTPYVAKRTLPVLAASSYTSESVVAGDSKSKKRKSDTTADTTENRSRDEAPATAAVTPTANKKQRVDHVHTDERKQRDHGATKMKVDEIKQVEVTPPVPSQEQQIRSPALNHHVDATTMTDLTVPSFSLQLQNLRSSHYDQSAVLKCISQGQTEFKQLYDYVIQQAQ